MKNGSIKASSPVCFSEKKILARISDKEAAKKGPINDLQNRNSMIHGNGPFQIRSIGKLKSRKAIHG